MADPLTITASIVGVAVSALHGTRLLLDDLRKIVDAPKVVEDLKSDLTAIETALQCLQTVEELEWQELGDAIAASSKIAVGSCQTACEIFRSDLLRWTKRSRDGKLSWRDRTKIGLFKEY